MPRRPGRRRRQRRSIDKRRFFARTVQIVQIWRGRLCYRRRRFLSGKRRSIVARHITARTVALRRRTRAHRPRRSTFPAGLFWFGSIHTFTKRCLGAPLTSLLGKGSPPESGKYIPTVTLAHIPFRCFRPVSSAPTPAPTASFMYSMVCSAELAPTRSGVRPVCLAVSPLQVARPSLAPARCRPRCKPSA